MRKQYHFRQTERGLLSWDVDRLIALTKGFPRFQIPLSAIRELDEPFWFGLGNPPTCRAVAEHARLIEAADLKFPIILSSAGRVMDGMHRVGKAALLGRLAIEAVRFHDDPDPDFVGVHPDDLTYDEAPNHVPYVQPADCNKSRDDNFISKPNQRRGFVDPGSLIWL